MTRGKDRRRVYLKGEMGVLGVQLEEQSTVLEAAEGRVRWSGACSVALVVDGDDVLGYGEAVVEQIPAVGLVPVRVKHLLLHAALLSVPSPSPRELQAALRDHGQSEPTLASLVGGGKSIIGRDICSRRGGVVDVDIVVFNEGPSRVSQVGVGAVVEHVTERHQSRLRAQPFTDIHTIAFFRLLAATAAVCFISISTTNG